MIWLSGLHVPETYLAALIQTACQRNGWALDSATLTTIVTDISDPNAVATKPETGCLVRGLFLEGAGWDLANKTLTQQHSKESVIAMPLVHLIPQETSRFDDFTVPVYVTQKRRDAMGRGHVFDAQLRTHAHPSHWILQGVALMLNIQE